MIVLFDSTREFVGDPINGKYCSIKNPCSVSGSIIFFKNSFAQSLIAGLVDFLDYVFEILHT